MSLDENGCEFFHSRKEVAVIDSEELVRLCDKLPKVSKRVGGFSMSFSLKLCFISKELFSTSLDVLLFSGFVNPFFD